MFPSRGARVWYDDQREVHWQIYSGDDVVDYSFMGTNPNSPDNRWLRDAMKDQIPIIYFLSTSPGRYEPIISTFIVGWHPERLRVQLAIGGWCGPRFKLPYLTRLSAVMRFERSRRGCIRHHSEMLCSPPVEERCAIEHFGQPLTKLDHAVFDVLLIGVDPDYRNSCLSLNVEFCDGPKLP